MPWDEIEVRDWPEFVQAVEGAMPTAVPFLPAALFRGHSKAGWTLKPTLLRTMSALTSEALLRYESHLLRRFTAESHLHVAQPTPAKMLKWDLMFEHWTVMRHHGVPTRLLDWSESPYVAAYFAVEADWDNDDGAVYFFEPWYLSNKFGGSEATITEERPTNQLPDIEGVADSKVVFVQRPAFESPRIVAQRGQFTFCQSIDGDQEILIAEAIDAAIAEFSVQRSAVAVKLVIPARLKPEFMWRLREMNVTAASLFPGADGLGRSLAEASRLANESHVNSFLADFLLQRRLQGVPRILYDSAQDDSRPA